MNNLMDKQQYKLNLINYFSIFWFYEQFNEQTTICTGMYI